jgi:hypothetical protein
MVLGLEAPKVPHFSQQQASDDWADPQKLSELMGQGLDLLLNLPFQLLDFPCQDRHHVLQAGGDGWGLGRAQAPAVSLQLLGQVTAGAGQFLEGPEPGWRSEGRSSRFRPAGLGQ